MLLNIVVIKITLGEIKRMKKIITTSTLFLIGLGTLLFSLFRCRVMADKINPFVYKDIYFTVVKKDGKDLDKDPYKTDKNSYTYEFTGYNYKGDKQDIIINTMKNLHHGAYLQIEVKDKNEKFWKVVHPNEIPKETKAKLVLK
ncbi:hypothetical protein CN386_08020 [Bacillus cereus]|nr:hypothetical protein CN386_08020 [Bacillus cereus]PGT51806.1 hypothetical protein COD14_30710 [Bacillus cereus]PGV89445.1 hypothetical protein COD86_28515 [Bacillus cereus]